MNEQQGALARNRLADILMGAAGMVSMAERELAHIQLHLLDLPMAGTMQIHHGPCDGLLGVPGGQVIYP